MVNKKFIVGTDYKRKILFCNINMYKKDKNNHGR